MRRPDPHPVGRSLYVPSPRLMALVVGHPDPEQRARITLIASTGLRHQEQLALRWDFVDLAAGKLFVTESSIKPARTIPLGRPAIRAFAVWRDSQPSRHSRQVIFAGAARPTPLVSSQAQGRTLIRASDIRHFAVAAWLTLDIKPEQIAAWMGWPHHGPSIVVAEAIGRDPEWAGDQSATVLQLVGHPLRGDAPASALN